MFKRHQVTLMSNPACTKVADSLEVTDFKFYDKDGFELNVAEQKFYSAMDLPIHHNILNHCCWQEPWFELESEDIGLILDHSMFLCRCSYEGAAMEQLKELKSQVPLADYLLRSKRKWGFDFALDAVADNGTVYEVIHIEYDNYDYEVFRNYMINFEWTVRHTDWVDCANRVWNARDKWQPLQGFEQNHWKAQYLINWTRAEYTEKAV
jgi:hypothetical protein